MTAKRSEIKKAIVQTLAYSDIFDYPLTKEELWQYLLSAEPLDKKIFTQLLGTTTVSKKEKWYTLPGRRSLVLKRKTREAISNKKIRSANRIARILSLLPSVRFIGLSGALAMKNCDDDDDIDFFVITTANMLWTTRLFLLCLLQLLGVRRGRKDPKGKDKICMNMLITKQALALPGIKKDIYLAHEIVQIKPLINKNNIYEQFLNSHAWVRRYMYNSMQLAKISNKYTNEKISLGVVEHISKKIQLWSIMKHQTREIVSDTLLAFHPFDYRKHILERYTQKIRQYEI